MKLLALALAALALACSDKPKKALPRPPAPAASAPKPSSPRASSSVITAEKVKGFVAYRRAMLPMNKVALGTANGPGGKRPRPARAEKPLTAEQRLELLHAAGEAALKEAGIRELDVQLLTPILIPYYVQRTLAQEAQQQLDAIARRARDGKPLASDEEEAEEHRQKIQEMEALREAYRQRYGEEALAVLDAHEQEFLELGKAEMESVLGAQPVRR